MREKASARVCSCLALQFSTRKGNGKSDDEKESNSEGNARGKEWQRDGKSNSNLARETTDSDMTSMALNTIGEEKNGHSKKEKKKAYWYKKTPTLQIHIYSINF